MLPFQEAIKPEGLSCIIAHAERCPELLDDLALTQKWIEAGVVKREQFSVRIARSRERSGKALPRIAIFAFFVRLARAEAVTMGEGIRPYAVW